MSFYCTANIRMKRHKSLCAVGTKDFYEDLVASNWFIKHRTLCCYSLPPLTLPGSSAHLQVVWLGDTMLVVVNFSFSFTETRSEGKFRHN